MNVTLIGPVYPYRGGIAHYTTQLALSLRSLGHDCDVVSFRRQYPAWLYPGSSDKDPSQSAVQVNAEYLIDPFYPWTWWQSGKHILQNNTDLVVLQWWTTFWAFPFAYLSNWFHQHRVPFVYLVHNVLPHEEKPWDRVLVKLALSRADGFIVQTPHEKERLLSLIPQARIEISPHPAYTMLADQRVDKAQARQMLGLPPDQTVLLFFGIVRPYKGLKYLIEALSLLQSEGLTPFLLVAGDFWEERGLYEKQIEACGISGQVRLDDRYIPDEQAAVMFSAADGLVAPYVGGTQSGVAGIALGFGLPMIVTEQIAAGLSDINPELVQIVPPADARALAQAISALMLMPSSECKERKEGQDNWWRLVNSLDKLRQQIVKER
jgi:glycosyltransferase involved in cell wall biosynthesis